MDRTPQGRWKASDSSRTLPAEMAAHPGRRFSVMTSGLARLLDHEIEANLRPILGDLAVVHGGGGSHHLQPVDAADGLGRVPEGLPGRFAPGLLRHPFELDGVDDGHVPPPST